MRNDKGCCCCLPSEMAPILFGLFNSIMIFLWLFAEVPLYALFSFVGLLPVIWTFCDRSSKCARFILLITYIAESVGIGIYGWFFVILILDENCSRDASVCERK